MDTETSSLYELACILADAKSEEGTAKKKRISAEEQIAARIETSATGSKTVDTGEGLKVTVKRALGYTVDIDAIRNLDIPEGVIPLKLVPSVEATYAFDVKAYENIVENHPDVAARLASCVTSKPRKASVTLKLG